MTDPTSSPNPTPSDDAVEDRLRRTLTAVADRDRVSAQLDDLRQRVAAAPDGGSTGGTPEAPPTRRRAVGAVIAAAVLAVVVAGALAATRSRDDVTASAPPRLEGTGWYLPAQGSGWELVDIVGVPWAQRLSGRREVGFSTPDHTAGLGIDEIERSGDTDPVASLEQLERGSGTSRRTYGVHVRGDELQLVVARRGDRVLGVNVNDVDPETVYRVVDGWWESDGQRIDPVPGLVRTSDVSGERGRTGHTQVVVTVRRERDGLQLSYALTPSGATLLPTGIDDVDRGAGRGLEEDVQPRSLSEVPDAPGRAWEVGPDSLPGSTSVLSRALGADISIADQIGFAPPPPGLPPGADPDPTEQVVRRRAHIELLSALRSVLDGVWAEAVAEVGADPALAAPTLADVPTSDIGPGTTTTVLAADDTQPATSSTTTVPPTTVAPSIPSDPSVDPEARRVAEALVAFARDPSDVTFEAVRFSDPTTLAVFHGDGEDVAEVAEIVVDRSLAELRQPPAWALLSDTGPVSALDHIAAVDVSSTRVAAALTGCGFPELPDPGPHSVAIVPSQPVPCAERFAVVLNGDSGRISEVILVLPSA